MEPEETAKEYISRERITNMLISTKISMQRYGDSSLVMYNSGRLSMIAEIEQKLSEMSGVEIDDDNIIYALWRKNVDNDGDVTYMCACCDYISIEDYWYCPFCGSKMKGVK